MQIGPLGVTAALVRQVCRAEAQEQDRRQLGDAMKLLVLLQHLHHALRQAYMTVRATLAARYCITAAAMPCDSAKIMLGFAPAI